MLEITKYTKCHFEAVYRNESNDIKFVEIFNALKEVTDIILLSFRKDKIFTYGQDEYHDFYYEFYLSNFVFYTYSVSNPFSIKINIKELTKKLSGYNRRKDIYKIKIENSQLRIEIYQDSIYTECIDIIIIDEVNVKVDTTKYIPMNRGIITIDSHELSECLYTAKKVGKDRIRIEYDPENNTLNLIDNDFGDINNKDLFFEIPIKKSQIDKKDRFMLRTKLLNISKIQKLLYLGRYKRPFIRDCEITFDKYSPLEIKYNLLWQTEHKTKVCTKYYGYFYFAYGGYAESDRYISDNWEKYLWDFCLLFKNLNKLFKIYSVRNNSDSINLDFDYNIITDKHTDKVIRIIDYKKEMNSMYKYTNE